MKWRNGEIVFNLITLTFNSLILLAILATTIYVIIKGYFTVGILIGEMFIALFTLYFIIKGYKKTLEIIRKQREFKNSGLIDKLAIINSYKTDEEMQECFNAQRKHKIYKDENFIITEDFLGSFVTNEIFIIDGILDVQIIKNKFNGGTRDITMSIIYYDTEKYDFVVSYEYILPNTIIEMEYVANVIANKSKNFRKYPLCMFN